jgi:hypothetical protein
MPPAPPLVGSPALDVAPAPLVYAPLLIIVLLAIGVAVALLVVLRYLRRRKQ